jgi:hypothetical protein
VQEADVGRHLQLAGRVPTGLVEAEHGVGTGGDAPAVLVEMAATRPRERAAPEMYLVIMCDE